MSLELIEINSEFGLGPECIIIQATQQCNFKNMFMPECVHLNTYLNKHKQELNPSEI